MRDELAKLIRIAVAMLAAQDYGAIEAARPEALCTSAALLGWRHRGPMSDPLLPLEFVHVVI
jgi:hypothetical protein